MARIFPVILAVFLMVGHGLAWGAEPSHALIMHGAPKYPASFSHLEYANPAAPKGGILKEDVVGSFDNLNHHIILGEPAKGLDLTVDRLMQRVWDEPFGLYGLVAETVEIADDRSWIIFNLNPAARFHDGHPMTAEDVLFSYESYRAYGHPVRRRVYGFVDHVDIITPHRIKFTFGEGYDRESALILAIMPVLPKHYWTAEGRDISKTTLVPPLGSGPYKIADVSPGRHIRYERVKDYWARDLPVNRGHYNFDQIEYTYYRDSDIALQAFKAGETNLHREYDIAAWNHAYASPRLQSGAIVKKEYAHHRPERVRAFIFNTRRMPFNDIRVRKALSLAFNSTQVNRLFYGGDFHRITSYFPNSDLAHRGVPQGRELEILGPFQKDLPDSVFGPAFSYPDTTDPLRWRASLREAARLLNKAGFTVDNGRLVDEQGRPFRFEILLTSSADEKIALFYRETLNRLGIQVTIRTVDAAQFIGRLDQFEYDMVLYQWVNSLSPGNEQMNYWGSAAAVSNGSRNYAGVHSSVVDTLARGIGASLTRTDLETYTHALDRVLMHGYYSIPLYYLGADLIAHDARLKSMDVTPMYGTVLETWWMEKPPASK